MTNLREMKTRKSKFGFKIELISFSGVTRLAEIREVLLKFPSKEYEALMVSRMGSNIEFTLHTNNEDVANAMRGFL